MEKKERKKKKKDSETKEKERGVLNILKVRPHLNWNVFEIIRPLSAILSAVIALPITFALHSTDWFEYPQLFRPLPSTMRFRAAMNLQELSREFEIAAPILLAGLERELREPLMTR